MNNEIPGGFASGARIITPAQREAQRASDAAFAARQARKAEKRRRKAAKAESRALRAVERAHGNVERDGAVLAEQLLESAVDARVDAERWARVAARSTGARAQEARSAMLHALREAEEAERRAGEVA